MIYNMYYREIECMIKQSHHQSETIKLLELEIHKFNLRKMELKSEVVTILEEFEADKNFYIQAVS